LIGLIELHYCVYYIFVLINRDGRSKFDLWYRNE